MKSRQNYSSSNAFKIIFIGILTFFFYNTASAQNTVPEELSKTTLYADVGGHFAGQASINIESQIYSGKKTTWYARGGLGAAGVIMAFGGPGASGAVTMLTGKGNRHFEIAGGAFIGKDLEQDDVFVLPLLDFGYRYQKPEGGLIFKAKAGILGVGLGLGYAF